MECNSNTGSGSSPTCMEFDATGAGLPSIGFLNSNWDDSIMSIDQTDPFQSCLSSIVSSPVIGATEGDHGMIKELIGRLGVIHDSGDEMSRFQYRSSNNCTNISCYTTPLNSPPKPGLSLMDCRIGGNFRIAVNQLPPLSQSQQSSEDPGLAEQAARLSCFGSRRSSFGEAGDSREGSSLSEQITGGQMTNTKARNDNNVRKRKLAQRGKSKHSNLAAKNSLGAGKDNQPNPKKMKSGEEIGVDCDQSESKVSQGEKNQKIHQKDGNSKQPEPTKDYIHVRARRGEATDSHSLAERVRREKISQRMKVLQDLVPGCNKITGKAIMLDEIINYVQSLQHQVEFLSMKLATLNPRKDLDLEILLSKDMFNSLGSSAHPVFPLEITSAPSFPYRCLPSHGMNMAQSEPGIHLPNNTLNAMVPKLHGFPMAPSQVSSVWEDDHHNRIQMDISQHNQPLSFYGSSEPTHPQTKVER